MNITSVREENLTLST